MLRTSEAEEAPLLEGNCVPVVYYDGLCNVEIFEGNLRMIAWRYKRVCGRIVREPVAELIRPQSGAMEVYTRIAAAISYARAAAERLIN